MLATGKPFLEPDYTLNANTPEFISALNTLKDLSDNGGLVDNYVSNNLDGLISDMQNGRAVMSISPFNREIVLNDEKLSLYPGSFHVMSVPPRADGSLPVQTEVWYLVIPKNAPHKELAWDLIRTLSAPDATVREALNGSGATIELENGRIKVDAEGRTSMAKVWAGGDCVVDGREDLTVSAVAAGRDAAESIHRALMG